MVEKATGKVVMGIVAPSEKNLVTWLKAHPSYQVLLPAGKGVYRFSYRGGKQVGSRMIVFARVSMCAY